ncbi:MAG: NAD-dependent epimerase/dehydratase family protein, partial [Candidatus Glassbacteria bacterium]
MILVTGAAGFIGFHVARQLLEDGQEVAGLDSVNDYYSTRLKWDRVEKLKEYPGFTFHHLDLCNYPAMEEVFKAGAVSQVIHLAAQAGVRYSLTNPQAYQKSNLEGFLNILELCRHHQIENFVYASSSSVYGKNRKLPFAENDALEGQISLYGATKRANELMAHSYSHLYGLNSTGLRFFTAYGPWGRPDMALFLFCEAILKGEKISVYNFGQMRRDFTYIDDIVRGVTACLEHRFEYEIINLGNHRPVELL